jgi:hypothetical protein
MMPAYHNLEAYLDTYIPISTPLASAALARPPLSLRRPGVLTDKAMLRMDVYRMIRRCAAELGMRVRDWLSHIPGDRHHFDHHSIAWVISLRL